MEYQLTPKLIAQAIPVPVEAIVINGVEVGEVRPTDMAHSPIVAMLKRQQRVGSHIVAFGYGQTAQEAIAEAVKDLREQAENIARFLAEVDA